MARETRRQRREARRTGGEQPGAGRGGLGAGGGVGAGGGIPPSVPQPEGAGGAVAPIHGERRRGGFIRESWAELNKVEWPNRGQVIQGTVVVLIACAIVGAFLWGADQLLRPFVRDVLLGTVGVV